MRRYHFGGSVADGTITSPVMGVTYSYSQLHIEFHDGAGTLVTPTAGTVTLELSSDGDVWHRIPYGRFEAKRTYDPYEMVATAIGQAQYARATMDSITGAVTYTVTVQRW